MKQLFASATLRLTGWYLIILASISLLFSIVVYQVAIGETERRLMSYQDRSWSFVQPTPGTSLLDALRLSELRDSKASVIGVLVYMNIIVLAAGGGLSYMLARRTLRPIEEAHETQARFVSDASHELRTPLAAMTTELEVALQDPSLKKQEMREILASTLEEVERLTKLSHTLLSLSSANSAVLPQAPFAIMAVLTRVTKRFDQAYRLVVYAPKKQYQVIANESAIEELLTILIENALKYSPPESLVTIEVAIRDQKLQVSISNGGKGIPPEHLPHIFTRFYRIDTARTGRSGHGLGLALAHQISELHNAKLSVSSIPNHSTVFAFSLPIFRQHKAKNHKKSVTNPQP